MSEDMSMESAPVETNIAPEVPAEEAQTPAEKKLYRVKIDNNELDVDEDELLRGYQMSKAAQKRFQEAAQMNKRAEDFITMLKKDPKSVLSHPDIGVDLKSFAEQYLNELYEEAQLSPQEKQYREMQQRLQEYEAEKQRKEQEEYENNLSVQAQRYAEDYQRQFTEVLSSSGLPKTEYTVARLAHYMQQALQAGYDDVTPKDVISLVKSDYLTDIKAMFGASNEDILLDLLGEELTNKTVKAHMKKMQAGGKQVPTKPQVIESQVKEQPKKMLTRDEWKKQLDERMD